MRRAAHPYPPWSRPDERGSGSVLVLGLIVVVVGFLTLSSILGTVIVTRHRAGVAADLAALAEASAAFPGGSAGQDCRRARVIASAHGGVLASCDWLRDGSVEVEVRIAVPVPIPAPGTGGVQRWVSNRARAGRRPLGASLSGGVPAPGHLKGSRFASLRCHQFCSSMSGSAAILMRSGPARASGRVWPAVAWGNLTVTVDTRAVL
ncbi:MAG: hypothetical protein QG622_140 [Actinomycetota bacterium]|nr:hypothetical protein [Actinomycetota bacterium]